MKAAGVDQDGQVDPDIIGIKAKAERFDRINPCYCKSCRSRLCVLRILPVGPKPLMIKSASNRASDQLLCHPGLCLKQRPAQRHIVPGWPLLSLMPASRYSRLKSGINWHRCCGCYVKRW